MTKTESNIYWLGWCIISGLLTGWITIRISLFAFIAGAAGIALFNLILGMIIDLKLYEDDDENDGN